MRSTSHWFCMSATLVFLVASTGCDSQQSANGHQPVTLPGPPPATEHDHGHDHGDEHQGPHGGHVIELGRNHEYHAEIVEDDQQQRVTVYVLGKNMKELPIDANMMAMSLMVEGTPKTFELFAAQANSGMASRFDATDTGLYEALHEHDASGKLRVTIGGTPYVANVEHHDHDDGHDHGHAHGDDDGHGHEHDGHAHG